MANSHTLHLHYPKNELWIQTLSVELFQFPLIQWDSAKCPRQNRCPRLCGVSSKHCPHECRYTSIPGACQSVYTEFCIFRPPPWLILYTSESQPLRRGPLVSRERSLAVDNYPILSHWVENYYLFISCNFLCSSKRERQKNKYSFC